MRRLNGKIATKSCPRILLVETLLQWEMWLKSDELPRNEVINAENKHRYIMCLAKKVGRRNQGMGMKVAKFHQIMHIADDIGKEGPKSV